MSKVLKYGPFYCDAEVWAQLQKHAEPLVDHEVNDVLRKLFDLEPNGQAADLERTSQKAYEEPLLETLGSFGPGEHPKKAVIEAVKKIMPLKSGDLELRPKSNMTWLEYNINWAVSALRKKGKVAPSTKEGFWALP